MAGKVVYDFPSGDDVRTFFKKFKKVVLFVVIVIVLAILGFDLLYYKGAGAGSQPPLVKPRQ